MNAWRIHQNWPDIRTRTFRMLNKSVHYRTGSVAKRVASVEEAYVFWFWESMQSCWIHRISKSCGWMDRWKREQLPSLSSLKIIRKRKEIIIIKNNKKMVLPPCRVWVFSPLSVENCVWERLNLYLLLRCGCAGELWASALPGSVRERGGHARRNGQRSTESATSMCIDAVRIKAGFEIRIRPGSIFFTFFKMPPTLFL
jgi:hypothetical protein